MSQKAKFQVCNGYLLDFEQLARVLGFLAEHPEVKKVTRDMLVEGTGLANRQIESLVSVAAAMGLVRPGNQVLTPFGALVAEHDLFLEARGTLEWCHFLGAGTPRNLIWHMIFNHVIPDRPAETVEEWMAGLREKLAGAYSERTIGKHLREEVTFVVDAYLNRTFSKLEILSRAEDGRLFQRRGIQVTPLTLAAMLTLRGERENESVLQVSSVLTGLESPGRLFRLDSAYLRETCEEMHRKGWLRYESTHNLDQIRLRDDFKPIDFLRAYYLDSDPVPGSKETLL